jgi:autotransporter-associated beta strand protein
LKAAALPRQLGNLWHRQHIPEIISVNKLSLAVIRCSLMFLLPAGAYAVSAQWDLDPISGDWNTAANWTPNGVPNGPADTATFALSNTTDVSISANTEVNGITFTSAATNPYGITASPGLTLTISGVGITNNSATTQAFVTTNDNPFGNGGTIAFTHTATAGSHVAIFNEGGSTNFFNRSTAGSATIEIDGSGVTFLDNSTAGSAFIGVTDNSFLQFANTSSAGTATMGGAGFIGFYDSSAAGSATIGSYGGYMVFYGSSKGGTAQIELHFNPFLGQGAVLDISGHNAPGMTIGSIAGDEGTNVVFLGANNLTVGSNNLSTTFSGVIQGAGGSLAKIGTGTLNLTGASTYTGDTNVNRGVLQVDGSITSDTLVNHRGTLAGTGTVHGNVMNNDFGTVRPGGALGAPGVLTVVGNYTQAQYATLMIQIAGMSPDQFSVLNVLGNANLNGFLDPVLLSGFVPVIGDSFTFLNYSSLTGEFSHIKHRVFDNGLLQWSVIYEDNHAILTVEQHVPDQGSTFLLLILGLLGLVMYRRQLLRGQS